MEKDNQKKIKKNKTDKIGQTDESVNGKQKPTHAFKEEERKEIIFQQALAEVVLLLNQSPLHKYMFIADLETTIFPALRASQYAIFRMQGKPIGFTLWAKVNDAIHKRFMEQVVRLAPHEWSTGDNIWLMDIIAPKNKEQLIIEELKRGVFAGKEFMMQRFDEQGNSKPEKQKGL